MSTSIRPELSTKSKYWIEKQRYYELKHFCMQYPIWKKARAAIDGRCQNPVWLASYAKTNDISDPTAKCAEARAYYTEKMEMLEKAAADTDLVIGNYILKAVTMGVSYDYLKTNLNVPCGKNEYYELYRKFFWLLDKVRN